MAEEATKRIMVEDATPKKAMFMNRNLILKKKESKDEEE